MASRRSVTRLAVVVAVLGALTLGITYLATSEESPPPGNELATPGGHVGEPIESKEAIWRARYQAAIASQQSEQRRIAAAATAFDADLQSSPSSARDYLISFANPVPTQALLQAVASNTEITLRDLFTWQAAPGTVHPITGLFTAESLNWPTSGPSAVTDTLSRLLGASLDKQDGRLAKAEKNGPTQESREGASNQRGEVAALRAALSNNGPLLYGLSCRCTPRALDQLTADSRFAERAVEGADLYESPIFISDPLRDKIIQTNGRYGRE